jgi:hypothetical protein
VYLGQSSLTLTLTSILKVHKSTADIVMVTSFRRHILVKPPAASIRKPPAQKKA